MSAYALLPLVAGVAYIPLFITMAGNRPWRKQHWLFTAFLSLALAWSLTECIFRSGLFPLYQLLILKSTILIYYIMAVQFHHFTSFFYGPGQGRWLVFAWGSVVGVAVIVALGYLPASVSTSGGMISPDYGAGIIFPAIPLAILFIRNTYVFSQKLRLQDNPVLYNQAFALLFGLNVLALFSFIAVLPWGRDYPVSHFGNLVNAFILGYVTLGHRLVDIRTVLRQGLALLTVIAIGAVGYWLALSAVRTVFKFHMDTIETAAAMIAALSVGILIFLLRGFLFRFLNRIFEGESYTNRQKLLAFAHEIHNVFTLKQQGSELLRLIVRAAGCRHTYLLFPERESNGFTTLLDEPHQEDFQPTQLTLAGDNPIIEYLQREQELLTVQDITTLPEMRGLWQQEMEDITSRGIELFVPLVSRGRLVAILVLDHRFSGRYTLEDHSLLRDVASRVAVSIEKEYLRERSGEPDEGLTIVSNADMVLTSNLDIQRVFPRYVSEIQKLIAMDWSAIILMEDDCLNFLALYSAKDSTWQAGDYTPARGTGAEWVVLHRRTLVESDLARESRFASDRHHTENGLRTVVYLPLVVSDRAIGAFVAASRTPNAYGPRQIALLEHLASRIATPAGNARLYAKAEERARVDEVTGLHNRRSLDEMLISEIGRHHRYGGIFSMIVLDLDSFKSYNDTYGHPAGDRLLQQVGSVIRNTIRTVDTAFRYGGDEFAVLLPQTPINAARHVAERLRRQMAERTCHQVRLDGTSSEVAVTASIGVASWPADGASYNDVIAAADAALYHAKRSGGDRTHCASGTMLSLDTVKPDKTQKLDSALVKIVYRLSGLVDAQDYQNHSRRVSEYATALAQAIKLPSGELARLEASALIHDIGKIAVSAQILEKRDKLTAEEWEVIKSHPQLGATIADAFQLTPCIAAILHHHEKYDGTGYPMGLKGDKIPLEARILAIGDAFAAMTCDRPYSGSMTVEDALDEIRWGAGKQFDPHLAEVFISLVKNGLAIGTEKDVKEVKPPEPHPSLHRAQAAW